MINYKKIYTDVCVVVASYYAKPLNSLFGHVIKINGLESYSPGKSTRDALNQLIDYRHEKSYDEDLDIQNISDIFERTKDMSLATHKEKYKNFKSKIFKE